VRGGENLKLYGGKGMRKWGVKEQLGYLEGAQGWRASRK